MAQVGTPTSEKVRYIYESTDGGRTVYRREPGSSLRKKISVTTNEQKIDYETFLKISELAKTDPAIQNILDQLYTYWLLRYS